MEMIILSLLLVILVVVVYRFKDYKNLYINFTDGVSIIVDGKTIDCNDTLVKLFKYETKEEFLSAHPLQLTPAFQPDGSLSFEKANEMMEKVKKEGKCKFDWVFLTSLNEERWIEIDIFKIKKSFLQKDRYCMVWRDVSKRRDAEEKLKEFNENLEVMIEKEIIKNQEQERMLLIQSRMAQLGEMISMIAHQWRQPLAAISSSVIDMQMKMVFEKDPQKLLGFINKELDDIESFTQALTHTIDDFRDFYKPDKKLTNISVETPINKAYEIIKSSLSAYDIDIKFEFEATSKLNMYENEMMQVFLNIMQNSKDNFILKKVEQPLIKVCTSQNDEKLIITICDNGGGIDKQILNKIFEPYFSTKNEKNGTGLGLYMSLKIVEEHHKGSIKVKNTIEGVCFIIELNRE